MSENFIIVAQHSGDGNSITVRISPAVFWGYGPVMLQRHIRYLLFVKDGFEVCRWLGKWQYCVALWEISLDMLQRREVVNNRSVFG